MVRNNAMKTAARAHFALILAVLGMCLVGLAAMAVSVAPAQALDYSGDTVPANLDEYEDGSTINLAAGGKVTVPEGYTLQFSDSSVASYNEATHTISGLKPGKTIVTYTEKTYAGGDSGNDDGDGSDYDDGWDPDGSGDDDESGGDYSWYTGEDPDTGTFTINVISYDALQGITYRATLVADEWGDTEASLTIEAEGAMEPSGGVQMWSDSVKDPYDNSEPDARIDDVTDTHIVLLFDKVGTHTVEMGINGKMVTFKVNVVRLALNKSSVVLCKGKSDTLKVAHASKVAFASENSLVAKVSKKGKVTPGQLGNAMVRIIAEGHTFTCMVSVTSKNAYKAVKNAEADLKKNYTYSQPKRMQANYRDCSSFVSRCYWDPGLGRKIFPIGGSAAGKWAYPAAEQAQWLNRQGKRVAYKAVSADKLLPGDTLYFETDYAGRNNSYKHIDHAGIYVGGGLYLNTGGYGGKGTVGYWRYNPGDPSVKFIGRPISSFVLDRAAVSVKAGKSTAVNPLFAKGKVTYESSKPGVAKVSASGKITGKKPGTAIITAHCKAGTYRCKVTVK